MADGPGSMATHHVASCRNLISACLADNKANEATDLIVQMPLPKNMELQYNLSAHQQQTLELLLIDRTYSALPPITATRPIFPV